MLTNINIDETLVAQAMKLSGARSKREVVDRALRELVARATRPDVASLLGLGGLDLQYDHKIARGGGAWMPVEEPKAAYQAPPPLKTAARKTAARKKAAAKSR